MAAIFTASPGTEQDVVEEVLRSGAGRTSPPVVVRTGDGRPTRCELAIMLTGVAAQGEVLRARYNDSRAWELPTNCRNTRSIHRELLKLYEGRVKPDVRGPEGRQPELVRTDDQPAAVAGVLDRLLGPDDVPPGDVVVLSSHGEQKSAVAEALDGRLCEGPTAKGSTQVRFCSIRGFKGLEAAVVVLCELEDLDQETRDHQLYVGLSRARNHAVVVVPG